MKMNMIFNEEWDDYAPWLHKTYQIATGSALSRYVNAIAPHPGSWQRRLWTGGTSSPAEEASEVLGGLP